MTSEKRICQHCGTSFTTVKGDQRYCQAKCRTAAWTAERVQFKAAPRDRVKRQERDRWRRLMNDLKGCMTYEVAREWVRLGRADKLVRSL